LTESIVKCEKRHFAPFESLPCSMTTAAYAGIRGERKKELLFIQLEGCPSKIGERESVHRIVDIIIGYPFLSFVCRDSYEWALRDYATYLKPERRKLRKKGETEFRLLLLADSAQKEPILTSNITAFIPLDVISVSVYVAASQKEENKPRDFYGVKS
jgi:hypothetical protein